MELLSNCLSLKTRVKEPDFERINAVTMQYLILLDIRIKQQSCNSFQKYFLMIKPVVCTLSHNFAFNLILKHHLTTAIYVYIQRKRIKLRGQKSNHSFNQKSIDFYLYPEEFSSHKKRLMVISIGITTKHRDEPLLTVTGPMDFHGFLLGKFCIAAF